MITATADAAAASPRWSDLPFDLLRDVSGRLHAAADYVRFHAVCKPWRDSLPPAHCRPAFLPWLLAPPDFTGHRTARCVFSTSKSGRRAAAATKVRVPDQRWVISVDDGTAAWLLTSSTSGRLDPLPASAAAEPLPLLPDEITSRVGRRAAGAVAADGTIFLYAFDRHDEFNMALLRPGDAAWTFVQRDDLCVYSGGRDRYCVACHGGKIVVCHDDLWCIVPTQAEAQDAADDRWWRRQGRPWRLMPNEPGSKLWSSYIVESHGELLWMFVRVNTESSYYKDVEASLYGSDAGSMESALAVSVYALQAAEDGEPQWVRKDGRSLADRVLFLGRPISFAVDAARRGMSGGGCAYFILKSMLYSGPWSKWSAEKCRLFRYSFHDGTAELVEQLPEQWVEEACMWLTPQPAIASTEGMYVGNLKRKVDSYQLQQFFNQHGKVADARVMHDRNTGRSRGFGFVTMATAVDEQPADAIAKLHGQSFDGRPLKVKAAD
ncbi:hypothetical protein ACP70R_004133 [Stipagrostis hirtigluma subsp. patula]